MLEEVFPLIEKLSQVTGLPHTQVISEVFGEVKFVYQQTDFEGYSCWSSLWCYGNINPLDVERASGLLIHELGHRFLNDLDLTYSDLGMNLGYWENGKYIHVAGVNPQTNRFERTARGYPSPGAPYEQHGSLSPDYHTYQEDFADTFMNWARDTFTDCPAGQLRHDWMDAFVREHTYNEREHETFQPFRTKYFRRDPFFFWDCQGDLRPDQDITLRGCGLSLSPYHHRSSHHHTYLR